MQGEALAGYLSGLQARPARTRGMLFRLPAGYPGLVPTHEGSWVKGELVSVNSMARFTVLDMIEGVDKGLYERAKIPVEIEGQRIQAWAYVMTQKQVKKLGGVPIRSGNWRIVSAASSKE